MKACKQQLLYFVYWMFFFIISKLIFLTYHHTKTATLSIQEICKVILYGLRLDASFSGYLCILPFICFSFLSMVPILKKVINIYTYVLIIILSLLTIADLELYTAWGFRLDATPLQYFKNPREMGASIGAAPILLLLIIFIVLSIFFTWFYNNYVRLYSKSNSKLYIGHTIISLTLLVILFIPIRGGLQQIPINQSDVYFSGKIFANHAAVNVPWNVMHSLLNKNISKKNPYSYLPAGEAQLIVDSLYHHTSIHPVLLNTLRPNILFIILESYTSKFIGCLGGMPGVTPQIDQIAKEGMLFQNIFASGDRSEKGLVALLSGYPTQTTTSIIFDPSKTEKLPNLQKSLQKEGYHSSYYYGGELEFANIKSYLLNAGYQKLVSKKDFPSKDYNSKWGVHDHILLNKLLDDLKTEQRPFFGTLFTLSSHEPYEIPIPDKFAGNDETTKFKNAFYYTDQAIGDFITRAKKQTWWDSTLIILVADHGHRLPGDDPNYLSSKFRIPLILTGGALKQTHTVNKNIGSQTDIAASILQEMGIETNQFKWSKNLLDSTSKQFAFYIFNDGFGFVSPNGTAAFDNVSGKLIYSDVGVNYRQITTGKSYMQLSFADFLNR